jgi:CRISPR-associated endonuclease/helicase Cas3
MNRPTNESSPGTPPGREASDDWAHAPPVGSDQGPHSLDEHLRSVGELAAGFMPESGRTLARLAGLWHDLGKRRRGFQAYIRQAGGQEAHIEGRVSDRDKTHSAAGALWAERCLKERGPEGHLLARLLQYVIAGHHAGLDDWEGGEHGGGLAARLAGADAEREYAEALARCGDDALLRPDLAGLDSRTLPPLNEHRSGEPGRLALWLRMLFSALVDADFLDTEAYFDPARAAHRDGCVNITELQRVCVVHMDALATGRSGVVNEMRATVLAQCRMKATLPPGVFSLTVPTGGGKTLASLSFALDHALRHGQRRIVYAIPYTSIIEQTADVFRTVFKTLGNDVVIEHHSNADADPEQETARSRLACENWDAPLVVTTNVQLFESLFARKTSRCRKLHNLAGSVIVLDEAQLLPLQFLQSIVDVLRYLVKDFGATVLLCTATQPVLDAAASLDPTRGLRRGIGPVTEIIDDVPALYAALERVQVHLPPDLDTPRSWPELADEIAAGESTLAIVNRRADAAELFRLVQQRAAVAQCWHLSALMCAQHRSDTIGQIKAALAAERAACAAGLPGTRVLVVSTQLVEAGVDLDFPVVYRALAGLDAIAQAAGRCNREGRLPEPGRVHVFVPPTRSPPGLLALARATCRTIWHDRPAQPLALPLVRRYFKRLLHDAPSADAKQVCTMLNLQPDAKALSLPLKLRAASDAVKLIDEQDAATVLVRYRSPAAGEDIDTLIRLLVRNGPARWLMRKLQRYGVTLYRHQVTALLRSGDIEEIAGCPGLYAQREGWDGLYDPVLGVRADSAPGDPAMYVA